MGLLDLLADALAFLAEPWFALPWFALGVAGAGWIVRDVMTANSAINPPLKLGWPVVTLLFSVVGVALYLAVSRPPGIGGVAGREEKMRRFTSYAQARWRKVAAGTTHCVGGEVLGIMTAMVAARLLELHYWTEFWIKYAAGFGFGWIVFQVWAMRQRGHGRWAALWKGGRAEFFSMITVMLGMGLVMHFVTPAVVGMQPGPGTYAFWTFGTLGLMLGFALTFPMTWFLVALRWEHGQGQEHVLERKARARRWRRLLRLPVVLGLAALGLAVAVPRAASAASSAVAADLGHRAVQERLASAMRDGARGLEAGVRHDATRALDRAWRLARFADTARNVAPEGRVVFARAREAVDAARHALQVGAPGDAARRLREGAAALAAGALGMAPDAPPTAAIPGLRGLPVLDGDGNEIGWIRRMEPDTVLIAAGGLLGTVLGARTLRAPARLLLLGREYALLLGEVPGAG